MALKTRVVSFVWGVQMQNTNPAKAIIEAGFTGLPFKIYAVWSGYLAISFPIFLLVSVVARIGRFLSLIFVVYGVKECIKTVCECEEPTLAPCRTLVFVLLLLLLQNGSLSKTEF